MASKEDLLFDNNCALYKFDDKKWTKLSQTGHVQVIRASDEDVTVVLKDDKDNVVLSKKKSELTIASQQDNALTLASEEGDTYSIRMDKALVAEFTEKTGSTPEAEQESKDAEDPAEDAEVDEADEGADMEGDIEGDLMDEGDLGEGDDDEAAAGGAVDGKPFTFEMPSSSQPFSLSAGLFSADSTSVPKFNFDFGTFSSTLSASVNSTSSGGDSKQVGEQAEEAKEFLHEECSASYHPVTKLAPVEVDSGETAENLVWKNACVLFRFDDEERSWKERGRGDVKFLQHKTSKKVRLVLREDKTLKLRLNQTILPEIALHIKTDKSWSWCGMDYSEGEAARQTYAIRFKTKEIATEFNDLYNHSRENNAGKVQALETLSFASQQAQAEIQTQVSESSSSGVNASAAPAAKLFQAPGQVVSSREVIVVQEEEAGVTSQPVASVSVASSSSSSPAQGLAELVSALTAERDEISRRFAQTMQKLTELEQALKAEQTKSSFVMGFAFLASLTAGALAYRLFKK